MASSSQRESEEYGLGYQNTLVSSPIIANQFVQDCIRVTVNDRLRCDFTQRSVTKSQKATRFLVDSARLLENIANR